MQHETAYLAAWRPYFHPVCTLAELDFDRRDEMGRAVPLAVTLLGERLILWRDASGTVICQSGTCPHRSAGMHVGWINDTRSAAVCRYHGAEWGTDGALDTFPAVEAAGRSTRTLLKRENGWCLPTYPARIAGGLVWTCLESESRESVLPIPEEDAPRFVSMPIGTVTWQAGVGRMMEAALDNYHFAFTHQGTGLGDPSHPDAPRADTWVRDGLFNLAYTIHQPVNPTTSSPERIEQGGFEDVRYQTTARPNAARLLKTSSIGHFVIVAAFCPVGPQETRFYRLLYRDFMLDTPHDYWFDLEDRINAEDQVVVETMQPWELTTDLDAELQAVMDRPTVKYRQWLQSLGIPFA